MAESGTKSSVIALLPPVLAVAGLYALVAIGIDSPLWRSLVRGEPVGLETALTLDELTRAAALNTALSRMDYRLERVAAGAVVPPLFLNSMPSDLDVLAEVDTKKRVFLRLMLPLILVVNEDVAEDRVRLQAMVSGKKPRDDGWLAELAERYQSPSAEPAALLRRVDVVPPSLALAQAAEESGWGTSRFVREGNNLFGQIGGDIVPQDDQAGPAMASFDSLYEAVRAYVLNLNSHRAYENLRKVRAQIRARGAFPDGHSLAGALGAYSERGPAYVDGIRALIRHNGLLRFDHAKLGKQGILS
ncbi:MAG: glucosaminidase domain-containing protein [Magnetospirillum gryphiswaldense]|nr:glucosaminidase domain-containing protein [Magnetospirillum gryphiswaldense]